MARRKKNPWTSVGEIVVWVLWAALLVPVGFAGWAVGHYTSLGKPSATKTVTQTVAQTKTVTTSAGPAVKPPTTTASAAAGGNPAAGKAVFASAGCAACHTFAPAGSSGAVGPNLDTAPAADAKTAGMALAAFVKQSITDPNAYVPKGYAAGVMPTSFGGSLSSTQLADLVAFVVSGAK